MIEAFARVNGVAVPHVLTDRRPGDIAACYASVEQAKSELGWEAKLGLEEMCSSAWQFERLLGASNNHRAG